MRLLQNISLNISCGIMKKEKEKKAYIEPNKGKTKFKHFQLKQEVLTLLNEENFKTPTVVQAESLPITLQENLKDLCTIIYAYNGAGKTLTFLIPIFNSLEMIPIQSSKSYRGGKEQQKIRPQAIIVFPTEALMSQVYEYLESYANFYEFQFKWPLKIGRIYANDVSYGHIIVGLPKKICDYIQTFDLTELKWIVFDQCDKIKQDSIDSFTQILAVFSKNKIPSNFIITSATGEKKSFRNFIQDHLPTHNILELDTKDENMGLKGVTHYYSTLKDKEKNDSIFKLLSILSSKESKVQVIIFFNEIKELEYFYQLLLKEQQRFVVNDPQADSKGKNNITVDYIHARCGKCKGVHRCNMDCSRSKTSRVAKLRNGETQVLLGTETIGRGIDIRTVSLVINYSEPKKNKEEISSIVYIHRVGRTGRYSDEGIALTYINNETVGPQFLKVTAQQQKIEFFEMKSEQKIIDEALICSKKNEELGDDSKHRFQHYK